MHGDQLLLRVKLQKLISVSQVGGLALSVTPNGVPPLPKGEARNVPVTPLALPLKDFPRSGEDVAQRQKGDKVSPKVTERAHPAPPRGAAAAAAEGPSNRRSEKKVQRRRPPPAADTGRSCWGSGLQDASAAQGTKQTQDAATRRVQRVEIAATLPR